MPVTLSAADAAVRLTRNPFGTIDRPHAAFAERLVELEAALAKPGRADASRLAYARAHVAALRGRPATEILARARTAGVEGVRPEVVARLVTASARCVAALGSLVGDSQATRAVRATVWAACFGEDLVRAHAFVRVVRDHDVLITGETGTGKEHVASAFLAATPGQSTDTPASAAINVAAVPETLVESELFGHRRGAFTGAGTDRKGLIRSADGGCFFLDEVGELSATMQAKLLRVIETDTVMPVGADVAHQVDVRFISATHRNLRSAIEAGSFREDLYQRLAGMVVHLPPLRERPEDLVPIGEAFLRELDASAHLERDIARVRRWLHDPALRRCRFAGNVRELKNGLRNVLLGLPSGVETDPVVSAPALHEGEFPSRIADGVATLDEVEAWYVERALARAHGNQTVAASVLGIDRTTLARRTRRAQHTPDVTAPRGRARAPRG